MSELHRFLEVKISPFTGMNVAPPPALYQFFILHFGPNDFFSLSLNHSSVKTDKNEGGSVPL